MWVFLIFFFNWEGVYMTFHALKAQKWLELDLQQVRRGFLCVCFSGMNSVILFLLNVFILKITKGILCYVLFT